MIGETIFKLDVHNGIASQNTLGVNCGVTGMPLISTLLIIGVHQFSSQFEINITDLYMF